MEISANTVRATPATLEVIEQQILLAKADIKKTIAFCTIVIIVDVGFVGYCIMNYISHSDLR